MGPRVGVEEVLRKEFYCRARSAGQEGAGETGPSMPVVKAAEADWGPPWNALYRITQEDVKARKVD